jgi:peroxiredoxin (alkyl hydroperoxide reductase subunit C)
VSIIEPGTAVPDFVLKREDGEDFTQDDLAGTTTVLVFYPFAFSSVCTDQFQVYEEVLDDITAKGAVVYGVSTDASPAQAAFREKLGVRIEMLSDFEPKGETCRKLGAYFEPAGMSNRALIVVGPDGVVRWSHLAANPGEMPGANLIFDGLEAAAAVS